MFPLSPFVIANALHAPSANVSVTWPLVEAALNRWGISSDLSCIAALATLRVETRPQSLFLPSAEQYNGDPHKYFEKYDGRFGNTHAGDGYKYRGRGFLELTFLDNYRDGGAAIGVDLLANPDAAMTPENAAALFAWYFEKHHIDAAADAQDWKHVRRLVNGGLNGWLEFSAYVTALINLCNCSA